MSHCDRCKKEIKEMMITSERSYDGGTLVITNVNAQKCLCDEQILLEDAALMAGYARHLTGQKVIGTVTVSLEDLKQQFSLQDILPKIM